jgi:hypothetical protein
LTTASLSGLRHFGQVSSIKRSKDRVSLLWRGVTGVRDAMAAMTTGAMAGHGGGGGHGGRAVTAAVAVAILPAAAAIMAAAP